MDPTLQNLYQILVIVLLIVIIISVVILLIQINRTLKTLNFILEDTENLTEKISYLSDHPERVQELTEKYVSSSIENVINTQVMNLRKSFADQVLGSIVNNLRKRRY